MPAGDVLPPQARAIVVEEEALLARVLEAVRAGRPERARDERELLERLKDLREQAAKAAAHDLPTLFQEMSLVRSLLEQPKEGPLPDASSPYFAHLRLREGGVERDYCLGRATFVETGREVRVVDWRFAPVARIFYRYREGDPFEEQFPGRLAEGTVEARRVVVIHGGRLLRILAGGLRLLRGEDGAFQLEGGRAAVLEGGAGTAARAGILGVGRDATDRAGQVEISALLDREQHEALSASGERPLLVLGSAGSGKTTVALHRLATLAFEDRERFPVARMRVVVPEPGLARLSVRLLEPLGLTEVQVRTLDAFLRERMHGAFGVHPPRLLDDAPPLVVRLKRHPALYHAVRQRLLRAGGGASALFAVRREVSELLTDRAFLGKVVESARGELPTTAIDEVVRRTMLQLAPPMEQAVAGIDPSALETVDGRSLAEGTPDDIGGTLDVEDVPIFLSVKAWRTGMSGARLSHLVVDEAEDLSLFELFVLGKLLGEERSVTLAGDEAQQTSSSFGGWAEALSALGAQGAAICRLQVTYRCPKPIAAFARALLGPLASEALPLAGREGAPVGRFEFPAEAHASLFVVDAIRDLLDREPQASVGVIARTPEAAQAFYRLLADLPEARLVLNGEFSFQPGLDVTDVSNVKGLEFDYVVVPDASASAYPLDDESRRLLHVAATRASHQLWVVSVGAPSPLLVGAG
jgi:DNA helicase IV